jgi:two-component system, NarL family, sensor histidine kinase DesK
MTLVTSGRRAGVTSQASWRRPKLAAVANIERWERIGRWFMSAGVLFFVPVAVSVLITGFLPPQLAVGFSFLVWGAIWVWLWVRVIGRDHGGEVVGLAAITILSVLYTLLEPDAHGTILVFASIVAGVIFPTRKALLALAALTVLQALLLAVRQVDPLGSLNILINNVFVGLVGVGARLFWEAYRELVRARGQLAQLAVTEERLRFARDLHDLLGQSLSVLVLKSELVQKQLPDDADQSLRQEVRDIAHVSRKSLNDVREAVAGYRGPTLQAEISSARTALRAAGIGLRVEDAAGALPLEQDGVLAWCLREAVTNVVKHSGAKKCEVRLTRDDGHATLDVSDDGSGAASLDGGSGLAGMRERVELVGGTMRVGAENGGGLHLQVTVPKLG